MVIETNLKYIVKIAAEKEDENWAFRSFLKQLDMEPEKLDAVVHQITNEVTSQIDCTKCANCCKQIKPILDKDDISEFALGLKMSAHQIQKIHLSPADDNLSKYVFNKLPCPFLEDNLCINYECRPKDCHSYPHLHKEGFTSRLLGVLRNYEVCPIVFNVYERLKAELWHYDYAGFDEDDFDYE